MVSKGLLFFPLLLLPSSSLPTLDTGDFMSDLNVVMADHFLLDLINTTTTFEDKLGFVSRTKVLVKSNFLLHLRLAADLTDGATP